MLEPLENIGMVCDEHASKPNSQWNDLPLEFFVGKPCKLGFDTNVGPPRKEHMWVNCSEVREFEGKTWLYGKLDNDPIFVKDLSCGDEILFERHEIEAIFDNESNTPILSPGDLTV